MNTEHLFARDDVAPSWWANLLGRVLSLYGENLFLEIGIGGTSVFLPASANEGAAVISIDGRWRYVESSITVAHPGGAAGIFNVYATAKDNNIVSTPAPYTDSTDYSFGLAVLPAGTTPTIVAGTLDVYRLVAQVGWDGSQITWIEQSVPLVGPHAHRHEPGGIDELVGLTDENIAAANKDGTASTPSLRTLGAGAAQAAAGNDSRLSNARTPTAHAASHEPGGTDALAGITDAQIAAGNKDGATGVPGMRTLGPGASQAAPGNDARLSNARTPTAHASTHGPGASDPLSGITDAQIAAVNKDGAAATPSLRTLGAGAAQAAAGNDSRLSNARTPTAHATSHEVGGADEILGITDAQIAAANIDGLIAKPSLRTLGAGAQQAMPGDVGGAWTQFTPVLKANGSVVNVGSAGTAFARYKKIGRTMFWSVQFTFSGVGLNGGTGPLTVDLPVIGGTVQHIGFLPTMIDAVLYVPSLAAYFPGRALVGGGTSAQILMPETGSTPGMQAAQSASAGGAAGTGIPAITGQYSIQDGGNLLINGSYETVA